ncbi:MAG TPA: M23 family metallopeptidase [Candidatus Eisenbacteria bacterium]|nr:M23 family metallopeptidase [Candidatus Eisenbacteria bacterium]
MREHGSQLLRTIRTNWKLTVIICGTTLGLGGASYELAVQRSAALQDAAWLRQRLTEKRALVRALQADMVAVEQAAQRVSQMASIARDHNVQVRRMAQLEEPRDVQYTPARLAALDYATANRSEDAGRALAQLAFLEEQLAATTDSLSLMMVLSRSPRPCPPAATEKPARSGIVQASLRSDLPTTGVIPSGWPVRGEVSSPFGWRDSPYGRGSQRHMGIDIRAGYGEPVAASAGGVVVFAGRDAGGYGTTVVIDHGQDVKTLYGHLSGVYVHEGQRVARGTTVGAVGNSGRSTGVHLHYEVRVGNVPVDPMLYVNGTGVQQVAFASRSRQSR